MKYAFPELVLRVKVPDGKIVNQEIGQLRLTWRVDEGLVQLIVGGSGLAGMRSWVRLRSGRRWRSGGCSAGLGGIGRFGFAGVDVAAGCCVELDGDERRWVFVGRGLVGDFLGGAVVAVRTSGTEVAPIGFRSVLVCFFLRLSSLAGA